MKGLNDQILTLLERARRELAGDPVETGADQDLIGFAHEMVVKELMRCKACDDDHAERLAEEIWENHRPSIVRAMDEDGFDPADKKSFAVFVVECCAGYSRSGTLSIFENDVSIIRRNLSDLGPREILEYCDMLAAYTHIVCSTGTYPHEQMAFLLKRVCGWEDDDFEEDGRKHPLRDMFRLLQEDYSYLAGGGARTEEGQREFLDAAAKLHPRLQLEVCRLVARPRRYFPERPALKAKAARLVGETFFPDYYRAGHSPHEEIRAWCNEVGSKALLERQRILRLRGGVLDLRGWS